MIDSFALYPQKQWGELSKLQSQGFYWVNVDRKMDAVYLCQQVIKGLATSAKAALICYPVHPEEIIKDMGPVAIKKMPLYSLPEKKQALKQLTTDLTRALTTNNRLYLLVTHSSLWHTLSPHEFHQWIQQMHQWLAKEQSVLLIVNYGTGAHSLKELLISQHRCLHGLSHIEWLGKNWQYDVSWWATDKGLVADQIFQFIMNETDWLIKPIENTTENPFTFLDQSEVYAEQNVLENSAAPPDHWHLIENNQAVSDCCTHIKEATLIFALYNDNQMEELVQQVNKARTHCGRLLKIIVREMSNNLRFTDQRILMTAGANLVVPHQVPAAKFLTMIDSVQGQVFLRDTPEDLDTWYKAIRPMSVKGYLPPDEFSIRLNERIENTFLPENGKGVLIFLRPVATINASQAFSICHLNRTGDIITISDNQLILFLSDCRLDDLELTFSYIFKIPVKDVFSNYTAWDKDLPILNQLKKINPHHDQLHTEGDFSIPEKNKTPEETSAPVVKRQPIHLILPIADEKDGNPWI